MRYHLCEYRPGGEHAPHNDSYTNTQLYYTIAYIVNHFSSNYINFQ